MGRAAPSNAVKFAVLTISEGLRQDHDDIDIVVISPGVTRSEFASTITDPGAKAAIPRLAMAAFSPLAIEPQAIARAVAFSIRQPAVARSARSSLRPAACPH
ncbi:hypothetical protein [Bosea vaviloviae]|uniref:hypothetical protein n=1 Tax=Bosea vaviloviae TaxID=1526658 RepID=UPI0006BAFC6D|nr:hypothetical protein [Bosea vaviloviae]